MTFSISSKPFLTKVHQNAKRVDNRVDNYLNDTNENNIHDVRTAVRKLDASLRSLPKNIRKKTKVRDYMITSKHLFKINSQIRDYDIIHEKLEKYSLDPMYNSLTGSLKKRRDRDLASARKVALSLQKLSLPPVSKGDISEKKLRRRFNKIVSRFSDRIELNFPLVLANIQKKQELHEMRKDCKKLRYLLELLPSQNNRDVYKTISELENIQNILGSIHDNDIMITYLKSVKQPKAVRHILKNEMVERNRKYKEFIQFCKSNLSNSQDNFFNQIWSLT